MGSLVTGSPKTSAVHAKWSTRLECLGLTFYTSYTSPDGGPRATCLLYPSLRKRYWRFETIVGRASLNTQERQGYSLQNPVTWGADAEGLTTL